MQALLFEWLFGLAQAERDPHGALQRKLFPKGLGLGFRVEGSMHLIVGYDSPCATALSGFVCSFSGRVLLKFKEVQSAGLKGHKPPCMGC